MGTPSAAPISDGSAVRPRGSWTSRHSWAAVAVALTLVGVLGSVAAASAVSSDDAGKSRKSFERSSGDIASTLQLAIQHEADLVTDVGAFVAGNPIWSQAGFARWTGSARVLARYPELRTLAMLIIVPAAKLAAYAATHPVSVGGPRFAVVPPGARPYYCLPASQLSRGKSPLTFLVVDVCAGDDGLLAARDSGQGSYNPIKIGNDTLFGSEVPVYSGASTPGTVAARRASFVGWVGTLVDPSVLLDRALQNYPRMSVSLRYHVGAEQAAFAGGHAPAGAHSFTTDLHNGWTVTTAGAVAAAGVWSNPTARELLLTGAALSILLGALLFTLATGRERARRQVEERTAELRFQALHDALTGLPNRALVTDRIEQLLARGRRNATAGSVLFMDLDDFKNVNDTLGHHAGDRLLVAVAARLVGALRQVDTIARMGGDEFVVLIDGGSPQASPELVAERLLDVMRQPFDLDRGTLPLMVNISIGIATGDRASAGDLLRDADVALYQAKNTGKNRYATFHPAMQTTMTRRTDLDFDLRSALTGHQYRLVYQPIYTLDDLTVIGVEALLRWDHPTLGLISPDEFIPILEHSGQIRAVGRWVLHAACTQMAAWHAKGDTLDVSVNVSARQLDDDTIITDIADALHNSGLDPASLIIEITETALMSNAEDTAQRLRAIKALGVRIAVDDFGTAYSSLAYLRRFPVDSLKIDRTFTHAVTTSPESAALIRTLVQLGKDLGLRTLAEGIETTTEIDLLRGAHVDHAQGFLMAHPLDPHTLETQLLAPTRHTSTTKP